VAHILITRPLVQARATAERVAKGGHCPHIVSLVEIVPLEFVVPDENFEALLATSANAFRTVENRLAHLRHLPLFCVGERTKNAAQKVGFFNIRMVAQTATHLISYLETYTPCHFLYLAGRVRRPLLEQELAALGYKITVLETYHACPLCPDASPIRSLALHFDAALFYSALSARQAYALQDFFDERTRFLCLSTRIADALPPPLHPRALIAAHPNETSLLALL